MSSVNSKVLVVGTTPDYVESISKEFPGRALFLTDPAVRNDARQAAPEAGTEVISNLQDVPTVESALVEHLSRWRLELSGIACYDCESMELAAVLAKRFDLAYPSQEAVLLCRDKLRCKQVWRRAGVTCPRTKQIRDVSDVANFMADCGGPIVLKPLTGSGSELVFRCDDQRAGADAFRMLQDGLASRTGRRMYCFLGNDSAPPAIAEQCISGTEYSCDAIVDRGSAKLIRVARKYRRMDLPFGTIRAYELLATPLEIDPAKLSVLVFQAANALGLNRAMCMIDFVVHDGRVIFLEIAPRPGGDCLPALIRQSCGLDILGAHLDFAEGKPLQVPPADRWERLVGLRIHADQDGVVESIRAKRLDNDTRIREVTFLRTRGDKVQIPPKDYDSWLLGHVVFQPHTGDIEPQCDEVASSIIVNLI